MTANLRIGEIARRTGLSPTVLRAWERRYGLIVPERSSGGTRLYSEGDLARVAAMQAHMAAGLSAAQAAAATLAETPAEATRAEATRAETPTGSVRQPADAPAQATADPGAQTELSIAAERLRSALIGLDRSRAEQAVDYLLRAVTFETLVRSVVLPYLVDVGGRWERGEASIAEEHLATNILRARLLGLTHGLGGPSRGQVVLACPPEERHDLALVVLAVALGRAGWEVTLLGADTPVETVAEASRVVGAQTVVLAAMLSERFDAVSAPLRALAAERRVLIAGPGASRDQARRLGAELLESDPIDAAATLERLAPRAGAGA